MWESPRGCLMFSFTIQMEDGRVVPLVQYVVCLAMTEAINDVCHKNVSSFPSNVVNMLFKMNKETQCRVCMLKKYSYIHRRHAKEQIIGAIYILYKPRKN